MKGSEIFLRPNRSRGFSTCSRAQRSSPRLLGPSRESTRHTAQVDGGAWRWPSAPLGRRSGRRGKSRDTGELTGATIRSKARRRRRMEMEAEREASATRRARGTGGRARGPGACAAPGARRAAGARARARTVCRSSEPRSFARVLRWRSLSETSRCRLASRCRRASALSGRSPSPRA